MYEVSSEVRGQLKVLESIDRLSHRRKMEKEKDQILKAAKSRSRPEDPEAAAKIKEQAKKVYCTCTWDYTQFSAYLRRYEWRPKSLKGLNNFLTDMLGQAL